LSYAVLLATRLRLLGVERESGSFSKPDSNLITGPSFPKR